MELLRLRASAFPRGGPTRGRARGKYLASDICLAGLSCRRKRVARKDLHLGLYEGPAAAGVLDWKKQWAAQAWKDQIITTWSSGYLCLAAV